MGNAVKVAGQIRIIDLSPSFLQVLSDLFQGAPGSSPRSKPVRAIQKVCLKDRLQNQQYGHLDHPVSYTGDSQGPQLAISLGNIDPAHRQRSVGLGPQFLFQCFQKSGHPSFLYLPNGHPIRTRCPSVRSYPSPGRFQYIPAIHPVVQGIKSKLTFLLGLTAQFPSQKRDLLRHPGFQLKPFGHPFRNKAFLTQAGSPSFDQNMTEVRPLRSIPFPGLPRYYGPLRLPTGAVFQVMDSLKTLSPLTDTPSGLPGSSTDLSARALLNHPGRPSRCPRSLLPRWYQTSPSPAGWSPSSTCNEAESGSLSLGLTPSLSRGSFPFSPLSCRIETGLFPAFGHPRREAATPC